MKSITSITAVALISLTTLISRAHELPHAAAEPDPAITKASIANQVSIQIEGAFRVIRANGIPDHKTGDFPNRNNPNRIAAQNYTFKVPAQPQPNAKPTPLGMHPFGVALNGVVFDPAAAEWWNRDRESGWQYEPMLMEGRLGADESNGHVQPTGSYHYHAVPTGLLEKRSSGKPAMIQLGWAADGFPIYSPLAHSQAKDAKSILKKMTSSYRIKKGTRPSGPKGSYDGTFVADYEFVKGSGDLDECNGRFGVTPEFPGGTYYYVLTEDFPFIPRYFMGTPDQSFFRKGPPPNGMRPRRDQQGPPHSREHHDSRNLPPDLKQAKTQHDSAPQRRLVTKGNQ